MTYASCLHPRVQVCSQFYLSTFHFCAGGLLPLLLIRNSKTVDPRDGNSTAVYQVLLWRSATLGTLMGMGVF